MMEEQTAKIDAYLSDVMSLDERTAFELAIEKDLELKEEVILQKKTFALLEAAAFIETKDKIRALNEKKLSESSLGATLLKVAAVLLVLVIPTYFILNNQFNDEHLFADYSEPYPDRITTMGDSDETKLNEAMSAYNKQEYTTAAKLFKAIRLDGTEKSNITLYEAVSLTYSRQAKKAIDLLTNSMKATSANSIAFEWQMVLSLLANNQGEEAKKVLDKFLKHNDGYQQEKAVALQKDLNRIWR